MGCSTCHSFLHDINLFWRWDQSTRVCPQSNYRKIRLEVSFCLVGCLNSFLGLRENGSDCLDVDKTLVLYLYILSTYKLTCQKPWKTTGSKFQIWRIVSFGWHCSNCSTLGLTGKSHRFKDRIRWSEPVECLDRLRDSTKEIYDL